MSRLWSDLGPIKTQQQKQRQTQKICCNTCYSRPPPHSHPRRVRTCPFNQNWCDNVRRYFENGNPSRFSKDFYILNMILIIWYFSYFPVQTSIASSGTVLISKAIVETQTEQCLQNKWIKQQQIVAAFTCWQYFIKWSRYTCSVIWLALRDSQEG